MLIFGWGRRRNLSDGPSVRDQVVNRVTGRTSPMGSDVSAPWEEKLKVRILEVDNPLFVP
jgi:hypothetical protein